MPDWPGWPVWRRRRRGASRSGCRAGLREGLRQGRVTIAAIAAIACFGAALAALTLAWPAEAQPVAPTAAHCRVAVAPDNAERVHAALLTVAERDGCRLAGVQAQRWTLTTRWHRSGTPVEPLRWRPRSCRDQNAAAGLRLTLDPSPGFAAACPTTLARLHRMADRQTYGRATLIHPEARRPAPDPAAPGARAAPTSPRSTRWAGLTERFFPSDGRRRVWGSWGQGVAFGAGVVLWWLATSWLRRRARRREKASPLRDLPAFPLALGVGGLAAFLVVALDRAATVSLDRVDVSWLTLTLNDSLRLTHSRELVPYELALLSPLAELDASRWAWASFAVHCCNGWLLHVLATKLGLGAAAAALAGMIYVACPPLACALLPQYLLEFVLITAYLGVTIAYLQRAAAVGACAPRGWLALEIACAVVGFGNKESFVVYVGVLVALELTVLWGRATGEWRERLRAATRRLAPHLLLLPILLLVAVPQILRSGSFVAAKSYAPLALLQQLANLLGTAGGAVVSVVVSPGWGGALVIALLIGSCAMRDEHRPVRWFAACFALIAALPMLPLVDRTYPGYLVQPWAGVALCVAGALAAKTSPRWIHGVLSAWLVLLFVGDGRWWRPRGLIDNSILQSVSRVPDAECERPTPRWQVDLPTWRALRQLRFNDPVDQHCSEPGRSATPAAEWECVESSWRDDGQRIGEANNAVGLLHQLLWIRCGNRRGHVDLATASPPTG